MWPASGKGYDGSETGGVWPAPGKRQAGDGTNLPGRLSQSVPGERGRVLSAANTTVSPGQPAAGQPFVGHYGGGQQGTTSSLNSQGVPSCPQTMGATAGGLDVGRNPTVGGPLASRPDAYQPDSSGVVAGKAYAGGVVPYASVAMQGYNTAQYQAGFGDHDNIAGGTAQAGGTAYAGYGPSENYHPSNAGMESYSSAVSRLLVVFTTQCSYCMFFTTLYQSLSRRHLHRQPTNEAVVFPSHRHS